MAIDQESFNKQLYDLLKVRGYKPVPKNNKNENVSTPQEAHVFEFTFKKDDEEYGKVWATIDDAKSVIVYFDSEQAESPEGKTPGLSYDDSWTGFLEHLKIWAQRKQLDFDLANKDRLGDDMRQREYWKMKQKIEEGYHPMGKQASYNDSIPTVKIILQHTRQIQEGEQRFRNVHKIFLENSEGERFLAPTIRPGIAQVYARHLAEGGEPNDERWNHIKSLCEEYNKMAGFVRATRSNEFSESVQPLVNEGINHYIKLRESLGKLRSHRGYNAYFESWTPALMEEESDDSIAEMFVEETLDPRIESVMPILSRLKRTLPEMQQMPEVQQLEEWSSKIITNAILNESGTSVYYPNQGPITDVELHELRRIDNPGDIKDVEFLKQIKKEGYTVLEHPETFKVYFYDTVGDFIDSEHDSIPDAIEYAKENIYSSSWFSGDHDDDLAQWKDNYNKGYYPDDDDMLEESVTAKIYDAAMFLKRLLGFESRYEQRLRLKRKGAKTLKNSDIEGFVKDAEPFLDFLKDGKARYYKGLLKKLKMRSDIEKLEGEDRTFAAMDAIDMMIQIRDYISKNKSQVKESVELEERSEKFYLSDDEHQARLVEILKKFDEQAQEFGFSKSGEIHDIDLDDFLSLLKDGEAEGVVYEIERMYGIDSRSDEMSDEEARKVLGLMRDLEDELTYLSYDIDDNSLNEISKRKIKSYLKKARADAENRTEYDYDMEHPKSHRFGNRIVGIERAEDRLYGIDEDLDANQKRVGQLGPYEKVGSKGAVGKLVGESFEDSFTVTVDGKEYKYGEEIHDEEDNRKIFHYVIDPEGKEHSMDWSPYDRPSKEDIELWIEMGMPSRRDFGLNAPFGREHLEKHYQYMKEMATIKRFL